jgi:hypothetical protein
MSEPPDPGDLLPEGTSDEGDRGWGDDPGREADADADPDDLRRFLDERPPHHRD